MEQQYYGREGLLDDTKPLLHETDYYELKDNNNSYDEEFLKEYEKSKEVK